jgi:biofilm PGA synthesis N-glycosyltransferase PgaC
VATRLRLDYRRVFEPEPGKFHALNRVLETIETPLVVTLDADTYLYPEALSYIVARVTERPQDQHVCACAGAIVVEDARSNFLTRMQQWGYRLGINGVKRMQAAYNSALVAQGAFSAYWTKDVQAVGGWPDAIGEDIVLTWTMMGQRGIVQYEPLALSSTTVPVRFAHFMRQRSRWARGMFEGIRANPPQRQPRVIAKLVAGIDYLGPFLDIGYVFFWIPGLILAILGYPLIVSWWSMLIIPITLVVYNALRRWQEHHVFRVHHVDLPADRRGFWGYLFLYQALSSIASIRGYTQYLICANRQWK